MNISESSMINISLVLIKPKHHTSVLLFNKHDSDEYNLPKIQLSKNAHITNASDKLLRNCISEFLSIKKDEVPPCYYIDLEPFYANGYL